MSGSSRASQAGQDQVLRPMSRHDLRVQHRVVVGGVEIAPEHRGTGRGHADPVPGQRGQRLLEIVGGAHHVVGIGLGPGQQDLGATVTTDGHTGLRLDHTGDAVIGAQDRGGLGGHGLHRRVAHRLAIGVHHHLQRGRGRPAEVLLGQLPHLHRLRAVGLPARSGQGGHRLGRQHAEPGQHSQPHHQRDPETARGRGTDAAEQSRVVLIGDGAAVVRVRPAGRAVDDRHDHSLPGRYPLGYHEKIVNIPPGVSQRYPRGYKATRRGFRQPGTRTAWELLLPGRPDTLLRRSRPRLSPDRLAAEGVQRRAETGGGFVGHRRQRVLSGEADHDLWIQRLDDGGVAVGAHHDVAGKQ